MTGSEVRAQRIAKRIRQGILSAYAGLYQTDLCAFERGRKALPPSAVAKLTEGLDVIPLLRHEKIIELQDAIK